MKFSLRVLIAILTLFGSLLFAQTEDSVSIDQNNIAVDSIYEDMSYVDQTTDQPDTLNYKPRAFSESKLDELRKDQDFNYAEAPTVGESLLERLWNWFISFIGRILANLATTNWGNVLLYVLALAVLILVVMMVLKVDAFRILSKGDSTVRKDVFHENIHEMDFDALIQDALGKRDYRNAVRLVFLKSLKILSDKQHIDWQPGKTNHDYLDEVQSADVKKGLGQLSYYFDYAWYGGFPISETQFSRVKTIFDSWQGTIR